MNSFYVKIRNEIETLIYLS